MSAGSFLSASTQSSDRDPFSPFTLLKCAPSKDKSTKNKDDSIKAYKKIYKKCKRAMAKNSKF